MTRGGKYIRTLQVGAGSAWRTSLTCSKANFLSDRIFAEHRGPRGKRLLFGLSAACAECSAVARSPIGKEESRLAALNSYGISGDGTTFPVWFVKTRGL